MKTVMHIVLSLEIGGLERLVVDIVNGMDHERFHPILCSLESNKGTVLEDAVDESRIERLYLNREEKAMDLRLLGRLIEVLKRKDVDVVHTHNAIPLLYGSLAARIAGVPVHIHTKHGSGIPGESLKSSLVNVTTAFLSNRFIAVSNDVKETVIKGYRLRPKKVTVIKNGIDINRYNVSSVDEAGLKRKELGLSQDAFIIGIVARLSCEKDHSTTLKAFSIVVNKFDHADVKLLVVGDGPLRDTLIEEAGSLGIEDRVLFLGNRNDIPEILSAIDLFALSSLTEGISLTLLEAMAVARPVVTTDVGGNSEVAIEGETGFLVPPKDPPKMAEAMIKLLKDKDLANKMGMTGRKRVEEQFNLDRMVREYENMYEDCLGRFSN